MKKISIAFAAIAMAACAHAAAVSWQSGNLYTAASKSGGWSSTMVTAVSPKAVVDVSIYMIAAEDWTADGVASMSQAQLRDYVSSLTASFTGQNKNTSGTVIGAANIGTDTLLASTKYYSVALAEYTDASYGDMYMASAQEFETSGLGQKTMTNIFGGLATASVGGIRNWQPVPEPTTGLLLLLGMAGLALKRKRS